MSVALECGRQKHRVRKRVLLETSSDIQNPPSMPRRHKPNILITGTPGTGKTTHSELVAAEAGLQHINIGALVREYELYDGYNEEFEAYFVNDDKVCRASCLLECCVCALARRACRTESASGAVSRESRCACALGRHHRSENDTVVAALTHRSSLCRSMIIWRTSWLLEEL
jgi:adenylate kinase family enzyme